MAAPFLRLLPEAASARPRTLTDLAVPKNRRPKFELSLKIIDLNNVPLVSGTSFIKWHLSHSTATEHSGRTNRLPIKDHKVQYDYEKVIPVRLTIDKNGMLQETWIHFEVVQEYSASGRGEKITLGWVRLNLAEYAEDEGSGPKGDGPDGEWIVRRYLMQESKINSTIKIGILMKQVDGDRNFTAPALKTAPVFGGIAGIMANDQETIDDLGHAPSLKSKSREQSTLQDMYRRTLAAYWSAQPGELAADECIEDIFAGGDGWGERSQSFPSPVASQTGLLSPDSVVDSMDRKPKSKGNISDWLNGKAKHERHGSGEGIHRKVAQVRRNQEGKDGQKSLEQQAHEFRKEAESGGRQRPKQEVYEDDVRDDLRSWTISVPATQ